MPKYNVSVQLTGNNGNAFAILGAVQKALKRAGAPQSDIDEFMEQASSGDYNNLLNVAMEWVDVE